MDCWNRERQPHVESDWHALRLFAPLVEREHPESVTDAALVHICTLVGVNVYNKLSM